MSTIHRVTSFAAVSGIVFCTACAFKVYDDKSLGKDELAVVQISRRISALSIHDLERGTVHTPGRFWQTHGNYEHALHLAPGHYSIVVVPGGGVTATDKSSESIQISGGSPRLEKWCFPDSEWCLELDTWVHAGGRYYLEPNFQEPELRGLRPTLYGSWMPTVTDVETDRVMGSAFGEDEMIEEEF